MVQLFQYLPGWSVPCISPFVTKVAYYMTMVGVPYRMERQDLSRLDRDAPAGKLPFIRDDDGSVVHDSTCIIDHLRKRYALTLDVGASPAERATMLAFNRLIDEHLYWTAVVQPRWRETANWEIYLRIFAESDEVPPDLRAFADDFRFRILNEFMNGSWGRLPASVLYERARKDIDALSDFLGDKAFFMGAEPRWVDANVLSILRHVIDAPFEFDTRSYAGDKRNLRAYMLRMNDRFGI